MTPNSSPPRRQTTSETRTVLWSTSASSRSTWSPIAVPVHVVDALEVVDVEHQDGDRVVCPARAVQLGAEALVEVAVVVEAGERVGLRLELEDGAHLRVVERERRRVAEALGQLELLLREARRRRRCGRR